MRPHTAIRARAFSTAARIEALLPDVLVIDVDAARTGGGQLGVERVPDIGGDALIEAELRATPIGTVRSAGTTHDATALELAQSARPPIRPPRSPQRPRASRARAACRYREAPRSGDPAFPSTPRRTRDEPCRPGVSTAAAVGDLVLLPSAAGEHPVARAPTPDGARLRPRTRFSRSLPRRWRPARRTRGIGHATPHARIQRQPQRTQQHLALAGRRERDAVQPETRQIGGAAGTLRQHDAAVRDVAHGLNHEWRCRRAHRRPR